MLPADTDPAALAGLEIVDRTGERIGRVRQVYPDGGDLGWAGVRGNLIGTTEALVPLDRAELDDDVLALPITRSRFLSALRAFYDDEPGDDRAVDEVVVEADVEPAPAAPLAARRTTGPARARTVDDGIERSEQRMHVSVEPVPRTRVVLRKVVVTEQRTVTVQVRREELRIVREPIEDAEAVTGVRLEDGEQELVLHEERVVVTTEVVPVERIRLVREVIEEQRDVEGEVWREVIEAAEEP